MFIIVDVCSSFDMRVEDFLEGTDTPTYGFLSSVTRDILWKKIKNCENDISPFDNEASSDDDPWLTSDDDVEEEDFEIVRLPWDESDEEPVQLTLDHEELPLRSNTYQPCRKEENFSDNSCLGLFDEKNFSEIEETWLDSPTEEELWLDSPTGSEVVYSELIPPLFSEVSNDNESRSNELPTYDKELSSMSNFDQQCGTNGAFSHLSCSNSSSSSLNKGEDQYSKELNQQPSKSLLSESEPSDPIESIQLHELSTYQRLANCLSGHSINDSQEEELKCTSCKTPDTPPQTPKHRLYKPPDTPPPIVIHDMKEATKLKEDETVWIIERNGEQRRGSSNIDTTVLQTFQSSVHSESPTEDCNIGSLELTGDDCGDVDLLKDDAMENELMQLVDEELEKMLRDEENMAQSKEKLKQRRLSQLEDDESHNESGTCGRRVSMDNNNNVKSLAARRWSLVNNVNVKPPTGRRLSLGSKDVEVAVGRRVSLGKFQQIAAMFS